MSAEQIEAYIDGCDWEQAGAAIDTRPISCYANAGRVPVQTSARFRLWCWVVIISAILGVITGYVIGVNARPHTVKVPHPAPWSCAKVLADLAPINGGGSIAPACGQTPYAEVTP